MLSAFGVMKKLWFGIVTDQLLSADPLTKALPQPKHEAHTRAMGIRYLLD